MRLAPSRTLLDADSFFRVFVIACYIILYYGNLSLSRGIFILNYSDKYIKCMIIYMLKYSHKKAFIYILLY